MLKSYLVLLFPLAAVAMVFTAYYAGGDHYYFWVSSNTSVMEMLAGIPLILALIVMGALWSLPAALSNKSLRPWLIAYTFSVFYFLGEDQNWGQHYIGWASPEFFLEHNKEKETNLHNMSSWFNQKPRGLMELWIIVAGILVPLGWEKPRQMLSKWVPAILWPNRNFTPLAVLTILLSAPERIRGHFHYSFNEAWDSIRFSELQEIGFALYMLLYSILLYRRLKSGDAEAPLFE